MAAMAESGDDGSGKPRKSPIYTRTGDAGTSSLYNGERRNKDDQIFEALGSVDELNSHLGLAYAFLQDTLRAQEQLRPVLEPHGPVLCEIQSRLLDVGAAIATPVTDDTSARKLEKTAFSEENVVRLERLIDQLDAQLPQLRTFILPGGGPLAAQIHVCRSVSRRAERDVVRLENHHQQTVQPTVLRFLNRLSDLLFVLARTFSHSLAIPDTTYRPFSSASPAPSHPDS
jgi:cob(I)alamin adenosyltransferase